MGWVASWLGYEKLLQAKALYWAAMARLEEVGQG